MTFRSRTFMTVAIALVVAALGASAASATPMTYQERQAIASRGQGAPTPPVALAPGGYLAAPSQPAAPAATPKSSDGADWALIAAIAAAAIAAGVALVAVGRRHTPATPS